MVNHLLETAGKQNYSSDKKKKLGYSSGKKHEKEEAIPLTKNDLFMKDEEDLNFSNVDITNDDSGKDGPFAALRKPKVNQVGIDDEGYEKLNQESMDSSLINHDCCGDKAKAAAADESKNIFKSGSQVVSPLAKQHESAFFGQNEQSSPSAAESPDFSSPMVGATVDL